MTQSTAGRPSRVLRWTGRVLTWLVILAASAAIAVAVVVPRIAGATPYTILTSSMEPTYPPGTLVVVRPTPIDRIGIGSVITFQRESGKAAVVTHRVVSIGQAADGERRFRTKGDANDGIDRDPVRPVQIKGTVWYAVPHLGRVGTWLDHDTRQTAVYVVAAALAAYAAWMFGGALHDRTRRRNDRKEADS